LVGKINQPIADGKRSGFVVMKSSDIGSNTASRIFRTIWRNPRISRVGIAERLNLDKSTVTNQVNHLIELGIIEEAEEGSSSVRGGRKPIQLCIRKSFGRVIGIEIQVGSYVAVTVDLAGEILAEKRGLIHVTSENFADTVAGIVNETMAELGLGEGSGPLLGVGVGTGGLVDLKKSLIRYSVPLDITKPLDFGKAIAGRIPVPCYIENDANCCAWGELAFNRDEDLKDFLFALVEHRKDQTSIGSYGGIGVGFGIVLGGKVYSGVHGNAGEFRSSFCEGRGNLQFSLSRDELSRFGTDEKILARTSEELARNMAMLVNTMDFDRVYVGGDIEDLPVDFPGLLRLCLEENWMYPFPKGVEIRYSSFNGRAVAYGAAGMTLDRLVTESMIPGLGPVLPDSRGALAFGLGT
jgi:predicted NBD/HSP70 family sugar kinase